MSGVLEKVSVWTIRGGAPQINGEGGVEAGKGGVEIGDGVHPPTVHSPYGRTL